MFRDADPHSFSAIYLVCGRTDMRYGIDSLAAIIENRYQLPLFVPGTLFLFCGRRANKLKGLVWEGDGFLLFTKRVDEGHFSWPRNSSEATKRISELFHLDNQWDDLNKTEREKQCQLILRPKVDDFFAWAKSAIQRLLAQSNTRNGLQYCINQEQFLRVFGDNGDVPMDNNLAEQAIRPFTIGRKNWVRANSIHGAKASTVLYSIVETAKANDIKVYDYLEYLIDELAKHAEDASHEFLKDLLP